MLKIKLNPNISLRHCVYHLIRQTVSSIINVILLALAFYGIAWLYLFSPEYFNKTLAQLAEIKPHTMAYYQFFWQRYEVCLYISVFSVLLHKVGVFFLSKEKYIPYRLSGEKHFLPSRKMTPKDIQYVSAHEAGHLLVYAALGQLPKSMQVEVKEQTDGTTNLGYVAAFVSKRVSQSRLFVEWRMLTALAGQEGESILLQDNSLGSVCDNCEWLNLATVYLKNHFEGIFYIEPLSKFELEYNVQQLNALKEKQRLLLQAFFKLNLPVYKQLTSLLMERKHLQGTEIIQFFQQANIQFPQNFPFPFGTFEHFSDEWTQGAEYDEINATINHKSGIHHE